MARPITLFTGQWADLPFDEVCRLVEARFERGDSHVIGVVAEGAHRRRWFRRA